MTFLLHESCMCVLCNHTALEAACIHVSWHPILALHICCPAQPVMPQVEDPWQKAQDMLFSGAIEEGVIRSVNKGGVIVQMGELRGEPCCCGCSAA